MTLIANSFPSDFFSAKYTLPKYPLPKSLSRLKLSSDTSSLFIVLTTYVF